MDLQQWRAIHAAIFIRHDTYAEDGLRLRRLAIHQSALFPGYGPAALAQPAVGTVDAGAQSLARGGIRKEFGQQGVRHWPVQQQRVLRAAARIRAESLIPVLRSMASTPRTGYRAAR